MKSLSDLWDSILARLSGELSDMTIKTWFDEITVVTMEDSALVLHCSNAFKKNTVEARFLPQIKAALKAYANALNRAVDSISESIEMSDGTDCQTALEKTMHREKALIIVVPEEATEFASLLQEIANEIEQETGVKVNITYRDKALGG